MSIAAALLVILFINVAELAYAQCTRNTTTRSSAVVYDRAPSFSSKSGWQLGDIIVTLSANAQVRICEEKKIGLFWDKKRWYRIEYEADGKRWRSGWVYSQQLNASAASFRESNFALSLLIPEVQAADQGAPDSGIPDQGVPGFNIWLLLLLAFIFIILGMIGKVVYDEVDNEQPLSFKNTVKLRKCIKALVVAPIVYGAFLIVGEFDFENEIAIIIFLCLAFQNGFFWQTVIPTKPVLAQKG